MKRTDHLGSARIALAVVLAVVFAVAFSGAFAARDHAQNAAPTAQASSGVQRILLTKADVSAPGRWRF